MGWPNGFDRAIVIRQLEEATGVALHVNDPLPDSLIAQSQALGLTPVDLGLFIFDKPRTEYTASELTSWAKRYGFSCGHCGRRIEKPEEHECGGGK